ncbi:hypothetical protein HBN50_15250 [Halobacteriovorax sp. GB3]|uniref:hypothetical protein n=1 Tax=Halobacteriovorax sp. GB3 TaxID=2719615 RepID=UPI00236205B0|nr:hypothetical protein [Halobacteriovorax sp. GB3]MDD0854467.1 hypothetical protein [Halobacteriovorax sp. GB3]
MSTESKASEIILESSLQSFFFDELQGVNQKSSRPLPNETIYYSSLVMDRYAHAHEYFEIVEGKVREKTLGLKLLETGEMSRTQAKKVLQDVGDTSLILCGYFSDSVNEKILNLSYYHDVGRQAYKRLNSMVPSFYDIDEFYHTLSYQFETLTNLIRIVQKKNHTHSKEDFSFLITKNLKAS